jgi:hypothetical protein
MTHRLGKGLNPVDLSDRTATCTTNNQSLTGKKTAFNISRNGCLRLRVSPIICIIASYWLSVKFVEQLVIVLYMRNVRVKNCMVHVF